MTVVTELAIGQVSAATGVAVSVIRYYDELELITAVRRVGGQRRFDPSVIDKVLFIRRAQNSGFSLEQIKALLDDRHRDWPEMLDRHLDELRNKRDRLDQMIETLEEARRCGCDVVAECSRIATR